jgi:nitrite reductase/ring-hydroxylating ferredoxin subunit/uncharacterized membrane protein
MKSKAHIKSHPLHPILIVYPIAFFIGAFIFDCLSLIYGVNAFWQTGNYLVFAGIAGALLAAIPGIIDYIYTVPPESSGKKRATRHGLINIINVLLFIYIAYYRSNNEDSVTTVLILEGIGVILILIAGWMGATLVHRNQIGVDHRYANAGKWNEAYINDGQGPVEIATAEELKINAMKLLHINGKRIALGRTEKGFYAFDDRCTHKGGSLADGVLICGIVHCPWHGSHFDVETGRVKAGPAEEGIKTYKVEELDGKIYLHL